MNQKIETIRRFLLEDLWRYTSDDIQRLSGRKQRLYNYLRCGVLSIQRFISDNMMDVASALTYTTLLALVPILAMIFALAKGFGFSAFVENMVRENFQGHDEVLEMLFSAVNSYLNHTSAGGLFIGIGFAFLVYTVLMMTRNVEHAFNQIWQKPGRSPLRMISDYFSVMLLVPFLWVFISGLIVFLSSFARFLPDYMMLNYSFRLFIRTLPFVFIGLSFTALYIFMPNTHVKFTCAVVPGFIAGATFVGVQYFYINSQIWISNYNAIYGSFAALPMFLIWAQVSWSIVLYGAELSYANQNVDAYDFDFDIQHASRRHQDFVSLQLLSVICRRFLHKGSKPYSAQELSKELCLPIRLVNQQLNLLVDLNWLTRITSDVHVETYMPACDLQNITVTTVLESIYNSKLGDLKINHTKFAPQIEKFRRAIDELTEVHKDFYIKDF